jgi:transposase
METFVGVDVAKDRLDVHVRPADEAFTVSRDHQGLAELVERLKRLAPSLVLLEATGGFERMVAAALAGAQLPLVVVNPRQIRDFARASGRLAKTDAIDAAVIAHFAEAMRPEPRPVPSAEAQALDEMVGRRRQILEMIVAENARKRSTSSRRIVREIDRHLAYLQKLLDDLDKDMDGAVRACPAWREAEDLITSVPGVAKRTARTLIAELPELGRLSRVRSPASSASRP